MEKFDITAMEKQLKKVNRDNNLPSNSGALNIITNSMMMYNDLITLINSGDNNKMYLLYQLSATIFKQLAEFQLVPVKKKEVETKNKSVLENIINDIEKN